MLNKRMLSNNWIKGGLINEAGNVKRLLLGIGRETLTLEEIMQRLGLILLAIGRNNRRSRVKSGMRI